MEQAEGMQVQNSAPTDTLSAPQDAQQEKVLKQSEVNELVGRIKHEAYTKGMRDAQASLQPAQPQGQSLGGMPQITDDHVRQIIADEAQKQAHMQAAQGLLNNFVSQMDQAKGKYSDFDATVANLGDMKNIPHIVELAADTGMAGDVMYELGRNPGKVASLTTLAYINPQLARIEMSKLKDSIKANQEAAQIPDVNEPLKQTKPSTVGKDNGSFAVRDFRRRYKA